MSEERFYTPAELSKQWHVAPNTIRSWFRDEPGVLKFGHASVRSNKKRRNLVSLRIPQYVADRVLARLSAGGWNPAA